MARLPTYERQVIKTDIGPAVGTQNLEGNLRQSQALQKLFDQATAWAGEEANKYAVEKATQDFLDQPLSVKDYENALRSGTDPIEQFKRGGVSYNDTIKKLHGHQARMELGSQTQALQESVLARVKRGELTDPVQIKKELESSVRGYGKAVSAIDVEQGMNYISTATTHSKYYYKLAMKELGDQAELQMQLTVNGIIDQSARGWETFLDAENDPGIISLHRQSILKEAMDTFKLTGKVTENLNKFNEKMDKVLFAKLGDKIALENFQDGTTKDSLMQDMQSGNNFGIYTNYYNSLTADDRNKLDTAVSTAMSNLELSKSTSDGVTTNRISLATEGVNRGDVLDLSDLDKMPKTQTQQFKYDLAVKKNDINTQLQSTTFASRKAIEDEINKTYEGAENTEIRNELINHFRTQLQNLDKKIVDDPVAYAAKHPALKGQVKSIMIDSNRLNDPDYIRQLKVDFADRQAVIQKIRTENQLPNLTLFSKDEVTYYKSQFAAISAGEGSLDSKINKQIGLATTMVDAFKGSSYLLFKEFDPKSPYAHIGNLVLDAMESPTPNIEDVKLLAKGDLIDQGLFGKINYELPANEIRGVNDALGEAFDGPNKAIVETNALKIYKALNVQNAGTFNDKLYEKAVEIAVGTNGEYGGIVEYQGKKMVIPSSIKREDFTNGLMNFVNLEELAMHLVDSNGDPVENIGPGNLPYTLSQFRNAQVEFYDRNTVKLTGSRTRLFQENDQLVLTNQNGDPLYLDMAGLYQYILYKNPEMDHVSYDPVRQDVPESQETNTMTDMIIRSMQ